MEELARYNAINKYTKTLMEQGEVPPPAGDVPPPPPGEVPPMDAAAPMPTDVPPAPAAPTEDTEEIDITDLVNMTKSIKKDLDDSKSNNNDVVGKMRKEKEKIKQELSQEEQEELSNEVFKRDIINAIIGGVARKTHYIYEKPEVKSQLDAIDPKLYQLYSTTIPLVDALYFLNEGMMDMAAKGGGVSAAVDVDDEEDPETGETKTVINATAFMFPILCHEIAKGIEEALARHGYSSDDNMANMTLGQADTLKSETEGLRIGPAILDKIRNILPTELFDKSDIGLIRFFFVELYKIPADEFINLMKYVISDTPSDQDYAKREFDELIEKAKVSKEKYLDYLQSQYMDDMDIDDEDTYDGGGFAPNQAPDDYTGGKQTNFDPSDFEDISLDELLKDLNIRRN